MSLPARILRLPLALLTVLSLTLSVAHAASSDWTRLDNVSVRLVSAQDAVGDGDQVTLGLQFELEGDWKVYWRSAGDAGYPPSIDWSGSENFNAAEMQWPLPVRFSVLGFETLGYKHEVVYPIALKTAEPGQALSLKANVDFLACAELCVPYNVDLALSLPAGPATPSAEAHLINRYQSQVPGSGDGVGPMLERAEFHITGADTATLIVTAASKSTFKAPDVFVEGPDVLAFSKPEVAITEDGRLAVLEVKVEGLKILKTALGDTPLTLTLSDSPSGMTRAAEFTATPTPATADTLAVADLLPVTFEGPSIWTILGLAVLGGLILNLMPCVLPVLSIKLLGIVGHGGGNKRTVRASFLASVAGIITSFLVLAAALVALKMTGAAIGWGIQFQQPWFLVVMTLIVTVFAANMWGFFEVHLPSAVAEIGEHSTHVHGLGGHFLSGALATALATPCSAPFLGTAVGFAMARGTFEIFAVFAALGLGLSLPYLAVALNPGLATRMPKPGRWMVILRRVLGFALIGTGAWLIAVLSIQVNEMAAWLIGALMVGVLVIFWGHHRLGRRWGRLDWIAVAMLAVLALFVPGNTANGPDRFSTPKLDALWQPFEENRIKALVASGQVVFVDVTAEWCLTCQVNKAVALSSGEAYARLSSDGVTAMQADWTRPSDEISAYLARFGRYGIPFNAVYGPAAPNGIALPELLSQGIVIDALDRAKGP